MSTPSKTPAELRNVFSENLAKLVENAGAIATIARTLEINRTQLNRYLSGDSFPRPDVLARICDHFGVDARILLEPLAQNQTPSGNPLWHPFLADYIGAGTTDIPKDIFPDGFYRFSRRSFARQDQYLVGVIHVHRDAEQTLMKGFENKTAMQAQDLPVSPAAREFRGVVMQQEDGICMLVSRQNTLTCSFNYLSKVASFENNFWVGYVTRTVPETAGGLRAARMVYEHLGTRLSDALPAARQAGFCGLDALLPFHRRLLKTDTPFR